MSENNITDLANPIHQDIEEMANAQQLLQEVVSSTDALRERIDQMAELANTQNQHYEALLQEQLDRLSEADESALPELRSEMEEILLSHQQESLDKQKTSTEELSSHLKSILSTLTGLHEQGHNMPAELALMREAFVENSRNTNTNIDSVRRTVHNDVTTLNENQLKFNADVELLKEKFQKISDLNTKLLFGIAGGLFIILILCVLLLFKGGNSNSTSQQVDNTEELRSKLGLDQNVQMEETGETTETILDETSEPLPDKGSDNQVSDNSKQKEEPGTENSSLAISKAVTEATAETITPKGEEPEEQKVNPEEEEEEEPVMPLPKDAERIISARAGYAATYLQRESFDRLANKYFHPDKGVHFYPFGLNTKGHAFTRKSILDAVDDPTLLHWGDINGAPIEMSFSEYYKNYIYDLNYDSGSQINFNELYASGKSGLSFAQIEEKFPGCIFADYYKQGKSLILVFEKAKGRKSWYISAVIHNE